MKPNCEGDNCARCNERKGEIPISSNLGTHWLCEYCDADLFETDTTFILQEVRKQIRHHKGEKNKEAVNSLEYIKSLLERVA